MNRERLLLDLLDSEDPSLREIYLSHFSVDRPSPQILHRIVVMAKGDASPKVRASAVKVLARYWPDPGVVALFGELLSNPVTEVLCTVVKAMNDLDDDRSLELLMALYGRTEDFQVKAAVLVAASRRPFFKVRNLLLERFLRDKDEYIRAMTATSLGRRGDHSVVPALLTCLGDPDHRVRSNALESLARFPDQIPQDAILTALSDTHHRVRVAALKVLHRQGWSGVESKVDEMLQEPGDLVKASVNHFLRDVEAKGWGRPIKSNLVN